MQLAISLEYRFSQTPDGTVWTPGMYARPFWDRYLEVFDGIRILARANRLATPPPGWVPATGTGVEFAALPYYVGPSQFLARSPQVWQAVRRAVTNRQAVILRVGSQLASLLEPHLTGKGHPFALEVVGDPYDVFAPETVRHPLRPFFRWWFTSQLRRQCLRACAVTYVTENALQQRYPVRSGCFSTSCSDVELPAHQFVDETWIACRNLDQWLSKNRHKGSAEHPWRLALVGSLDQLYKGPDVLLAAMAQVRQQGLHLELSLIGAGRYLPSLQKQAADLGLTRQVRFCGQLVGAAAVMAELDQADLFVLPSRTEGLPRALLEAMARGLPCIGSRVGGIPELLSDEVLVKAGDAAALSQKIIQVLSYPSQLQRLALQNLERARLFQDSVLKAKRLEFYHYLRNQTARWQELNP